MQRSGHAILPITLPKSAILVITLGLFVRDTAIDGPVRSQQGYERGTCGSSDQGAPGSPLQRPSGRPSPVATTGLATHGKKLDTPLHSATPIHVIHCRSMRVIQPNLTQTSEKPDCIFDHKSLAFISAAVVGRRRTRGRKAAGIPHLFSGLSVSVCGCHPLKDRRPQQ